MNFSQFTGGFMMSRRPGCTDHGTDHGLILSFCCCILESTSAPISERLSVGPVCVGPESAESLPGSTEVLFFHPVRSHVSIRLKAIPKDKSKFDSQRGSLKKTTSSLPKGISKRTSHKAQTIDANPVAGNAAWMRSRKRDRPTLSE